MLILGINTRNLRPLQAQQILSNTPPDTVGNSEGCNVAPLKAGEDWQAPPKFRKLSSLGPVYLELYRVQCTPNYSSSRADAGAPKKVILCWAGVPEPGLRAEDAVPGRPSADTPVWVSCSCRQFRYVCEWALTRYGSADIIYSNGEPAKETNPTGIGKACKHVYSALLYSTQHWKGESPEDRAVEEPSVEPTPQVPNVKPQQDLKGTPTETEVTVEELDPQTPPREASISQRIRDVAYLLDQDCC